MPQATRDIKRRIRSIRNTRQITRAMELVSAAKMRKSVANVLATRAYASLAWQLLTELSQRTDPSHHPLLAKREAVKRVGVVLVSSNRGLCGGFNNQIAGRVVQFLRRQGEPSTGVEVEVVTVGKRGRDIMFRTGAAIAAEFVKPDVTTRLEEVSPVAQLVVNDYLAGRYDKVVVAYTDFISALTQKPRLKQLLPIELEADEYLGAARSPARVQGTGHRAESEKAEPSPLTPQPYFYEYKFEPSPDAVLEQLMPRLIEVQLYQAMLESDAAEHSARMLAMRSASDAAKDMIDSLTLVFNQARQASITAELADITGGRVAVEA